MSNASFPHHRDQRSRTEYPGRLFGQVTNTPTRRTVLKSTALSIISSAFPVSVIAKQVLSAPVVVVYENGIAESVAFKNALKRWASSIHVLKHDPAETFRELTSVLRTDAAVLCLSRYNFLFNPLVMR